MAFDKVGKIYRTGQERSNLRSALPGRFGGPRGGELHTALEDVSFTLESGGSVGVIGHNGAGKSTLLKLVVGVATPSSGRVSVHGRIAALIELGTGFHPDMTGRENISFSAAVLGMRRRQLRDRVDQIIEFANIGAYLDTPVKRYSSGMMARLGFAVAAHLDADLLVLDEVLSVGDAAFQRKCHDRMRVLRADGVSLLYVTHALWTVPVLCQQAILLSQGRILCSGKPSDVLKEYQGTQAPASAEETGRVLVKEIVLEPATIDTGSTLVVRATLDVREPMPAGYVMLSLHTPDMATVAGSEFSAPALHTVGENHITCRLKTLQLAPGDYLVYMTVVAARDTLILESQMGAGLRVSGDARQSHMFGALFIDVSWDE